MLQHLLCKDKQCDFLFIHWFLVWVAIITRVFPRRGVVAPATYLGKLAPPFEFHVKQSGE